MLPTIIFIFILFAYHKIFLSYNQSPHSHLVENLFFVVLISLPLLGILDDSFGESFS